MDPNFVQNVGNFVPKVRHSSDYADAIVVRTLPLIGRVHIVRDVSGILQMVFVLAYWVYGTFSTLFIILLPHYHDGHVPYFIIVGYMTISVLCLLSLIKASITNPGRVPLVSEQSDFDTSDWTFCQTCQRKRPPKAHHCRRCQQCVLRMDHHCPWINNCVGEENHFSFMLLLLYAFLLGASSFILTMLHFWVWPKCLSCDQEAFHIKQGVMLLYLLVALSINMAFVMFCQLGNQHLNLLLDRTTIDNMQTPRAVAAKGLEARKPYRAYRELCGRGSVVCWMWPCRRRWPSWPLHRPSPV